MYWLSNTFYVVSLLVTVACTWHFLCYSAENYLRTRLKARLPSVKFV